MDSVFSLLAITAAVTISLTQKRILTLCVFYVSYGLLTVLNPDSVPVLAGISIYRILYVGLLLSVGMRIFRDQQFVSRIRLWPTWPWLFLMLAITVSAFYSPSNSVFSVGDPSGFFAKIMLLLLFGFAAAQIQEKGDLLIFAASTAVVSSVLSGWVIWNASRLNFAAYRGGILVNENYVSMLVLVGVAPLLYFFFLGTNRLLVRITSIVLLLFIVFASLILASRSMLTAAMISMVVVATGVGHSKAKWRNLSVLVVLLSIVGYAAVFLSEGVNFVERLGAEDIGTLNERTTVWFYALKYFSESSLAKMLFGNGLASTSYFLAPKLQGIENLHNTYLLWLMEQGLTGVIGFAVFLYSVARLTVRSNHPLKHVMLGWLAFFVVAGLSGTVSDEHIFWIVLGVLVGANSVYPKGTVGTWNLAKDSRNVSLLTAPSG